MTKKATTFLKRHAKFFLIVAFILGVSAFSIFIGPSKLVEFVGVDNVYLFTFFFGIIGGVSTLTATSFYASLFTFALGGANPFILALFSAPGVLIGDLAFWYAAREGKDLLGRSFSKTLNRFSKWLLEGPRWLVPVVSYIYTGLSPFPGDFLMISLALIDFPIKRVVIPILLGNYTVALAVSFAAIYGIDFVANLF